MSQSNKTSLLEASLNSISAFFISVSIQQYMFTLYEVYLSYTESILMVIVFTVISIIRNFGWRRVFVYIEKRNENGNN